MASRAESIKILLHNDSFILVDSISIPSPIFAFDDFLLGIYMLVHIVKLCYWFLAIIVRTNLSVFDYVSGFFDLISGNF